MRLSTPGFSRFEQARQLNVTYAGGEANVSTALAYWGHSTAHVTRFPDSPIGRAAAQYLLFQGVDASHLAVAVPQAGHQCGDDRRQVHRLEVQRNSTAEGRPATSGPEPRRHEGGVGGTHRRGRNS